MTTKQKLSNLIAAASAASNDLVYLVQSGISKKISIANLFSSISNTSLGNVTANSIVATTANITSANVDILTMHGKIIGHTDTLNVTASTTITLNEPITEITTPAGVYLNYDVYITNGIQGEIKYVVTTSIGGNSFVNLKGNISPTAIQFTKNGQAVILGYTSNLWHVFGGTANVTY